MLWLILTESGRKKKKTGIKDSMFVYILNNLNFKTIIITLHMEPVHFVCVQRNLAVDVCFFMIFYEFK